MNTDKIYAESIVNQYSQKQASKVVALRKLDRKAKQPSSIFAYSWGIIASLVLGVGMCLAMKVIGSGTTAFIIGIIVGILGIAMCSLTYPIYKKMRKAGMDKYAEDIILLAKDIAEKE